MNYAYIKTDYLKMVTGGDRSITGELVSIFRQQADEFYNQMLALNREGRYPELGQLAHKAKSSVSIIGMEKMAGMLTALERDAKADPGKADFISVIEEFRHDTSEALLELDQYLSNL